MIQLEEIKDICERRDTQKIPRQGQAIQSRLDFPKKRKKTLPTTSSREHTNNRMKKKQNNFGVKWERKEHNRKVEWINNME